MPTIVQLLNRLQRAPRWLVVSTALLLVAAVGFADYQVGTNKDLSVLYVPIIAAICWAVNLRAAIAFALLCSLVWLLDDWLDSDPAQPTGVEYWESAVRFTSFVALVVVLEQLKDALDRETALARSDALTGLANVKSFSEHAERASADSQRGQTPLTVIFLDCDHFKQVNDEFGHPQGDALLKQVADAIVNGIRRGDVPARMGGDEFAVLCPNTDEQAARHVAERLKKSLDAQMQEGQWPVTFSIGVVTFAVAPASVADLIRESDNLMYAVKNSTRNGVRFSTITG